MLKVTYLELHRAQLIEDIAHTVPNDIPCDFVIWLSRWFHRVSCHIVKCNHISQHSHGFVKWTETIIWRVTKRKKKDLEKNEKILWIFNRSQHRGNIHRTIIRRYVVPVLLQEIVFQQFCYFECYFICFGKRSLAYQLHDFWQIFFLLQDFLHFRPQRDELREVLVIEIIQCSQILTVWYEPVDGWEVFALRKFLIQTPEHLQMK